LPGSKLTVKIAEIVIRKFSYASFYILFAEFFSLAAYSCGSKREGFAALRTKYDYIIAAFRSVYNALPFIMI
jgi:hypothetical protein